MLLEIGNFNHKSIFHVFVCFPKNITRGSTDPEVGHQMTPLTLVANLATRQRHLHWFQFWPPDGATCISCKFGHQMAPLALVPILATRWCHLIALVANLATIWRHLHWFQFWPPDGAISISCKFGHQMAPLVCWFIWSSVGHQVA